MFVRFAAVAALLPATLAFDPPAPSAAPAGSAPAPAFAATAEAPSTWRIDASHSELTFTVRHLLSRVRGRFGKWEGTIVADENDWQTGAVNVTIQTASINTDNERRDQHLRTSDFFLADSFPTITFRSTKVERRGVEAKVYGDLTIRGVTKPVVLEGRFLGLQKFAQPGDRIAFEATTTINRLDYGVKWNRAVEGGGMTLGDEVKIDMVVAAIRQKG